MTVTQGKHSLNLRIKLMLLIEALIVVLVLAIGVLTALREKESLVSELHKRGYALAAELSRFVARFVIARDLPAIRRTVLSFSDEDYVTHIVILDNNCNIVMHSDLSEVGRPYEGLVDGESICAKPFIDRHYDVVVEGETQCHIYTAIKAGEVTLGAVVLGYSNRAVTDGFEKAQRQIFLMIFAASVVGGFFAYLLAGYIVAPLRRITAAIEKVAMGDTDVRIELKRHDEIGSLAASFDKMAHDLGTFRRGLEGLVRERTVELERTNALLLQEISDRKAIEEALRVSEDEYRGLVDNALVGIYKADTNGKVKYANQAFASIFEFRAPDEVISEGVLFRYRNAEDGKALLNAFKGAGRVDNFELDVLTKTDNTRRIILSGVLDGDEISGMVVDITDRKRAEEALRESERKYRNLFEESSDAVYMTSREGRFIAVNGSALRLFGYSKEEMMGMDVEDIYVDSVGRRRFQRLIERNGSVKDHEIRFRKKDGTELYCLVSSNVRRADDGGVLGYQGIIRDITKERLLEAQLKQAQKMEAIGTLAGGISHDFNNILQGIMGYVELSLLRTEPDHPSYKFLKQIEGSAQRGSELIRRLLVFSRKVESNLSPVDLNHEVRQLHKLLHSAFPRMIDIELRLAENLKTISADAVQLEQAMMNLAINARDAMADGGRLVFETNNVVLDEAGCRLLLGCRPGEYVHLSVSDTGHGMDSKTLKHIFEPFFTTKGSGHGTGLGLAMVYGIVQSHGGHILCKSEYGVGTTFSIFFPALGDDEVKSVENFTEERSGFEGNETILLVDDEKDIRDQGRDLLAQFGYEVITAEDGEGAVEIYGAQRDRIDLVILDVSMPGMGGHRCMEELMSLNPKVKIVIASGYVSDEKLKKTVESGAVEFVAKPYRIRDMLSVIRGMLDRQKD
jgi:two-component system cell cycle sensor histidine kinase/response regulator CckA